MIKLRSISLSVPRRDVSRISPSIEGLLSSELFHLVAAHFAMACGMYSPKKPLDLNRVGQVHRVASFVAAPWPVAISFVLGSQMSEQNYKEYCKILNFSNFWCVMNVHKLSLHFLFCSLFLQPQ